MNIASIWKHGPAAGLSAALIDRLRLAMSPPAMREILQRDWRYLRDSGEELVDCRLVRVSPRLPHGFVTYYEATLCGHGSERLQPLVGELTADAPLAHYRAAVGKLRKGKRRQLRDASPPVPLAVLPVPGMVLRLAGYDERLSGLKLVHKPRLLQPISPNISAAAAPSNASRRTCWATVSASAASCASTSGRASRAARPPAAR